MTFDPVANADHISKDLLQEQILDVFQAFADWEGVKNIWMLMRADSFRSMLRQTYLNPAWRCLSCPLTLSTAL